MSGTYFETDSLAFTDFAAGLELGEPINPDSLNKTIYKDFYHGSDGVVVPTREEMRAYSRSSVLAARAIREAAEGGLRIEPAVSLGWQPYYINGGTDFAKPIGRFYVNTKPDSTNPTIATLAQRIAETDIRADVKAALAVNDDDSVIVTHRGGRDYRDNIPPSEIDRDDMTEIFNRSDRIVIYTNPDHLHTVIDILGDHYIENPTSMNATAPRFTRPVTTGTGIVIPGVGFAEDFSRSREQQRALWKLRASSYGDFVRKMLSTMVMDEGISDDMPAAIAKRFEAYGRNPQDPALNDPSTFEIR